MSKNKESPLRQLPLEQQREVIRWLQNSTRRETVERIASEIGLTVTQRALGRFRAWWHMTRSLELAAEFADALRERLDKGEPEALQRERIHEAAQMAFELAAIERQDLAAFVSLRRLRQRDQAIEIARQRLHGETAVRTHVCNLPAAPVWSEKDRQAVMRKVDEVFGIAAENGEAAPANSPPCPS